MADDEISDNIVAIGSKLKCPRKWNPNSRQKSNSSVSRKPPKTSQKPQKPNWALAE
jgi:hypothetical protein